jgi:hypothetical protein
MMSWQNYNILKDLIKITPLLGMTYHCLKYRILNRPINLKRLKALEIKIEIVQA